MPLREEAPCGEPCPGDCVLTQWSGWGPCFRDCRDPLGRGYQVKSNPETIYMYMYEETLVLKYMYVYIVQFCNFLQNVHICNFFQTRSRAVVAEADGGAPCPKEWVERRVCAQSDSQCPRFFWRTSAWSFVADRRRRRVFCSFGPCESNATRHTRL